MRAIIVLGLALLLPGIALAEDDEEDEAVEAEEPAAPRALVKSMDEAHAEKRRDHVLSVQAQHPKGYVQLGGAGEAIADRIHSELGYKVHYAVADYLQRAARHLASRTDTNQAFAVGKAAVRRALAGAGGVIGIKRLSGRPYRWRTIQMAFEKVANFERTLPPDFIAADGLGVTDDFRNWCRPLIAGEDLPPFVDGLPDYLHLQLPLQARLLPEYEP